MHLCALAGAILTTPFFAFLGFSGRKRGGPEKNDLMHASIDRCSLRVGLRKVLFHVVLVSGTQKRYPPKPDTHAPMSASSMDI
jgi:hypothetical protein